MMSTVRKNIEAIVVAAGGSKQFRWSGERFTTEMLGRPMVHYAILAASEAFGGASVIVESESVAESLSSISGGCRIQPVWLNGQSRFVTLMNKMRDSGADIVVVIPGDNPLISPEVLSEMVSNHLASRAEVTLGIVSNMHARYPGVSWSYRAKIVKPNKISAIVAPDLATPGMMPFSNVYVMTAKAAKAVAEAGLEMPALSDRNAFDGIMDRIARDHNVEAFMMHETEAANINTLEDFATAERILAMKINRKLLRSGVLIRCPDTVLIDSTAKISPGVEIADFVRISGQSVVMEGTKIGRATIISSSTVAGGCEIGAKVRVEGSVVGRNCSIAEDVSVSEATRLGDRCKISRGAKIASSMVGKHVKIGIESVVTGTVIADSTEIGNSVVVGGSSDSSVSIGRNCVIESGSAILPPARIASHAIVRAGSVVTEDVGEYEEASARSRQVNRYVGPNSLAVKRMRFEAAMEGVEEGEEPVEVKSSMQLAGGNGEVKAAVRARTTKEKMESGEIPTILGNVVDESERNRENGQGR